MTTSLVINIPLDHNGKVRYKLYDKTKRKLELASELVDTVMPLLKSYQVILLCDSWYSKGSVLDTVSSYDNLDLIGAVRKDTAIFDLPPAPLESVADQKLEVTNWIFRSSVMKKLMSTIIFTRKVMTRLFKAPVYVTPLYSCENE